MTTRKLSNIPIKDLELFLAKTGCKFDSINNGHVRYVKKGCSRPIIFQTHIDPVPEFIIRNILRDLGLTKRDFFEILFCQ